MTHYAAFSTKSAWMGKEFGENLARRYFDAATVDAMPKNSKGKNAGAFKTTVEWVKVEQGGWVKSSESVERRVGKIIAMRIVLIPYGSSTGEVLASWGETGRF